MADKLTELYNEWSAKNPDGTTHQAFQAGLTAGAVSMRTRAMKAVDDMKLRIILAFSLLICIGILVVSVASAQIMQQAIVATSSPAAALLGTTFNETWNQTSSPQESCFSTTGCVNVWSTVQGSPSITTASSCGTGSPLTQALKLTNNATNPEIETYGSLPYLPIFTNTASYDMYWWMCWSSSTGVSNASLVRLYKLGTSNTWYFANNGTTLGTFYVNGTSWSSGASSGTWHLFHFNDTSGSCKIQVDGGSFNTPSSGQCPTGDVMEPELLGQTSGADIYFGLIYLSAPSYPVGSWPPSELSDWQGLTGTPTAASLLAGTHCGNAGISSSWTESSLTGVTFSSSAGSTTFTNPLNVCAVSYTGNQNTSVELLVPTTAGATGYWKEDVQTVYPAASWGGEFWFTGGPTQNSTGLDFAAISDNDGTINNVQLYGVSGSNQLNFENDVQGCSTQIPVNLVAGTHYWMTWGVSATGIDTLYLYNRSTAALLGSAASTCKAIAVSSFTGTSGTLTFTTATQNLVAGQGVILSGFTGSNTGLNGQIVTVLSAGLTTTAFEAGVTGSGYSSGTGTANEGDRPFIPGTIGFLYGKTGNETINTATDVFYGNSIKSYADAAVPIGPQ